MLVLVKGHGHCNDFFFAYFMRENGVAIFNGV